MLQTLWENYPAGDTAVLTNAEQKESLRVRDLMSDASLTITPDTSVNTARALMQQWQIQHLPVVEQNRLVGMVSDGDIRLALPSPATSLSAWELHHLLDKLTVAEVMSRFVVTVAPHLPVTTAIGRMLRHRIDAVPVTKDRQVIGMLTCGDVLRAFLRTQE